LDPVAARILADSLEYPVVLKPRVSEEIESGHVLATGAPIYAATAREFMDAWRTLLARCSSILVQEFIAGSGAGYFALVRHGEVRAEFAHRRIRDVRPTGSGSAVRESAPVDPMLRAQGQAILRALDWHGVAMVEFKRRPDGTVVFLEVNGRFWNSLPLAVYAGADFPRWIAELADKGDISGPVTYRAGVRSRWLLGDVRHLVDVWRGAPRGYRGPFPRRLAATAAFFTPTRGMYHDNFIWRDPLPELGDWIDFFSRKLPARLADKRHGLHASGRPAPS
jgi:predicted ATP-grasp superfamily ATP-dependent carboligase